MQDDLPEIVHMQKKELACGNEVQYLTELKLMTKGFKKLMTDIKADN